MSETEHFPDPSLLPLNLIAAYKGDPDLVAFIMARNAEDEAVAQGELPEAGPDAPAFNWTATDPIRQPGRIEDGTGDVVTYDEGSPTAAQAAHIARNDPARALRQAAAVHAHLDAYRRALHARQLCQAGEARSLDGYVAAAWGTLLADAAVWSDHPDHKASWS